ncbi:tryptophan synthase subunit beta [Pseudomonas stutzeri]|uniref:tryptophan synthase subunit beta n=1 Tax=Stutzerimonas stutzeri TaxID=316 RepID=UPI000C9C313B|nr:tryptophan synthase subunit beta [Stutzerimonas stutzeri]MCQ4280543.1 tryptophan synthase subunit beta [Stutzerimonas stutzeri]PNF72522.1 tryptophan synthase subunit beta [Stutzerimonas stutzeri]
MLYIKRDADGRLLAVEQSPFTDMTGELPEDDSEVRAWLAARESLAHLRQSDLDMVRVLEDLVHALIDKGVLRITDLPEAAQAKLAGRSRARDALGATRLLVDDDDTGLI